MRIHWIDVQNFRLLKKVSVLLEGRTTLIVGQNNSGRDTKLSMDSQILTK
jgi:predicted ATP-dependent endonuclease of OLD family